MNRCAKRIATIALFACLFTLSALPASATTSSIFVQPVVTLGANAPVVGQKFECGAIAAPGTKRIYFAVGTATGRSSVSIGNMNIGVPIANPTLVVGTCNALGVARASTLVPNDSILAGQHLHIVAIVITQGRARTSLCMPSGPILGDAIS